MKQKLHQTGLIVLLMVIGFLPGSAYSVEVGQMAPNFSVQNLLDGKHVSLEQLKGKVVYLDFWASWCPPCLKSFPFMEQLKQKYSKRGLVVIAISLDENFEDAWVFLNQTQASFVIAHNIRGDIATRYDVQAMPSTYLIGRDGKIKLRHLGFNTGDKDKLQRIIESVL
jgi:thiol-disulfide isomerase/thioredoxin